MPNDRAEKMTPGGTPGAHGRPALAAFGVGALSIFFQSLLFQRFFSMFDGGEWSIAVFFFTWFVWVAAGATVGSIRSVSPAPRCLARWLLAYVPACTIQFFMIDSARHLAGISAYETYGAMRVLPWALPINAPVSFLTGLIFVLVARSQSVRSRDAVARTAIWEAVGSCSGGVLFTLLAAARQTPVRMFLAAVLLAAFCADWIGAKPGKRPLPLWSLLAAVLLLPTLFGGWDGRLMEQIDRRTWGRLLPPECFAGAFTTPHGHHLYGWMDGQLNVLAWNSLEEAVPNEEEGLLTVLTALAQNPAPDRALFIGPGSYPACRALARLRPATHITWINPDPSYAHRLLGLLPDEWRIPGDRFSAPALVPRDYLAAAGAPYDLVILNLAPGDTFAANSYLTDHFMKQVQGRLAPEGLFMTRGIAVTGYTGIENLLSGASIHYTLGQVFSNVIMAVGSAPWFIASEAAPLSSDTGRLAGRLAQNHPDTPHQQAIWNLYDPFRTPELEQRYAQTMDHHRDLLGNRLLHPRTPLFVTLLRLRKEMPNMPDLTVWLGFLTQRLWRLPLLLLFAATIMRVLAGAAPGGRPFRPFDSYALVFCAGFAGFSLNMILLMLFQALFGSLYLAIGMISALYMLGYHAGGRLWVRIISAGGLRTALLSALGLHLATCGAVLLTPLQPALWLFALLFFAAGFSAGGFTPGAERLLRLDRRTAGAIATQIERMDHCGAALGALLTGLLMIPVMGITRSLFFLGFLPASLIIPVCAIQGMKGLPMKKNILRFAFWLLLLLTVGLASSWIVEAARQAASERSARQQQAFLPPAEAPTPPPPDGNWTSRHLEMQTGLLFPFEERTEPASGKRLYRFRTLPLTPGIRGYAGNVPMLIVIDAHGQLLEIDLPRNDETPQFFEPVRAWAAELTGHILIDPAFRDIDAVSGATRSAEAVRDGLHEAASTFLRLLQGRPTGPLPQTPEWDVPDEPLPGTPRDADAARIRRMIGQGLLSDHPASFAAPAHAE